MVGSAGKAHFRYRAFAGRSNGADLGDAVVAYNLAFLAVTRGGDSYTARQRFRRKQCRRDYFKTTIAAAARANRERKLPPLNSSILPSDLPRGCACAVIGRK